MRAVCGCRCFRNSPWPPLILRGGIQGPYVLVSLLITPLSPLILRGGVCGGGGFEKNGWLRPSYPDVVSTGPKPRGQALMTGTKLMRLKSVSHHVEEHNDWA